jgi:exopolyphosphatase/guanosine-5'-triphosphate,3'-diphosphate pyrophosphatase
LANGVYGVVDIGSNTVHLLVAVSDGIQLRRVDDVSVFLRLGADLELTGGITQGKIRDAASAILDLVERAEAEGAREVRLLATQAVRAASNRPEVVEAIEVATALPVTVLEPEREAFFAVLGAALTRSFPEHHLVIDVGGASTQISIASGETLLAVRSVPVGSGRLATRFERDPPARREIQRLNERIEQAVRPAVEALFRREQPATGAVVVGGAPRRVAKVVAAGGAPLAVGRAQLRAAMAYLMKQRAADIAAAQPIERDRVPMARAGALILSQVLRIAGLEDCTISPFGIREGAILDAARTAPWQPNGGQERAWHGQPAKAGV